MATKTIYKDKTTEELEKLLAEKREELRQIRFAAAGARPADSSSARKVRKDIARALTQITVNSTATN